MSWSNIVVLGIAALGTIVWLIKWFATESGIDAADYWQLEQDDAAARLAAEDSAAIKSAEVR